MSLSVTVTYFLAIFFICSHFLSLPPNNADELIRRETYEDGASCGRGLAVDGVDQEHARFVQR